MDPILGCRAYEVGREENLDGKKKKKGVGEDDSLSYPIYANFLPTDFGVFILRLGCYISLVVFSLIWLLLRTEYVYSVRQQKAWKLLHGIRPMLYLTEYFAPDQGSV